MPRRSLAQITAELASEAEVCAALAEWMRYDDWEWNTSEKELDALIEEDFAADEWQFELETDDTDIDPIVDILELKSQLNMDLINALHDDGTRGPYFQSPRSVDFFNCLLSSDEVTFREVFRYEFI